MVKLFTIVLFFDTIKYSTIHILSKEESLMKKFILTAAFLSPIVITIEAMSIKNSIPESRDRLSQVAQNLRRMSASTYDLTGANEVFRYVPEELNNLDLIAESFQRPVDVHLQRREAALRHQLLDLHTQSLRLLNDGTYELLDKLPNYAQQNLEWQEKFLSLLWTYIDILNAANNAPRGLTAEEQLLRNLSQARITHMRNFLGV